MLDFQFDAVKAASDYVIHYDSVSTERKYPMLNEDDYCLWLDVDFDALRLVWKMGYSYDNVNCMRWPEVVVGICQIIDSDIEQKTFLVRTINNVSYPNGTLKSANNWLNEQHFYAHRRQLIKVEKR